MPVSSLTSRQEKTRHSASSRAHNRSLIRHLSMTCFLSAEIVQNPDSESLPQAVLPEAL